MYIYFRHYIFNPAMVSEPTWYIKPTNPKQAFQPARTQPDTLKGFAAALTANQDTHRQISPSDNLPTK